MKVDLVEPQGGMSPNKFGTIVVVAGLLAFLFASEIRRAALTSEEDRTRNFQPGHLFAHLSKDNIDDDMRWRQELNDGEKSRHEKKLAEIEGYYWQHVIVAWLVCAGVGFVFASRGRACVAPATGPTPPPEPVGAAMVTCKCNACSGEIQFNEDGFDYRTPPTVTCPHCGLETLLYVPGGELSRERRD